MDCESAFLASSTRFLASDDGPPDSIVVVTAAESASGDDDYDAAAAAAGSVGRGTRLSADAAGGAKADAEFIFVVARKVSRLAMASRIE